MKHFFFVLLLVCPVVKLKAQVNQPSQTLRGTVTDLTTELPIPGATVLVSPSNPQNGTSTNLDGQFRFDHLAVGRYTISVSMLGYQTTSIPNIVIGSGKETIVQVKIQEQVMEITAVEITAGSKNKTEALNELTSVSARQFSIEETKRYAGALNDPGRMVQSFAGVTFNADGNNEIVVRGNSPRGVLWRMEGIEIPNPNHFSNQGASGGAISMLSNNMMDNSDFLSGAFPADYGNASSGVFDMRLRKGNNEKRETALQIGVIGTDVALEGPFSKKSKASYLINYRYSSLSMLQKLGVKIVGDAVPVFQDLSFNVNLPTQHAGNFGLFGIGGTSSIHERFEGLTLNYTDRFKTNLGVIGLTHSYLIDEKSWIKSVVALTHFGNNYVAEVRDTNDVFRYTDLKEKFGNQALRSSFTYHRKINRKLSSKTGLTLSNMSFQNNSVNYNIDAESYTTTLDKTGKTSLFQAYSAWQFRANDKLTINAGLHTLLLTLNQKGSIEPRAGLRWNFMSNQTLSAGFGIHSRMEDLAVYTTQRKTATGELEFINHNLGLSKAAHYVLGYDAMLSSMWHLKAEAYYQQLFNVPVNAEAKDAVSLINSSDGLNTTKLSNTGRGRNHGLELTLEKYFGNSWYLMNTLSLYQSTYSGSDNIWRNTQFNGNYAGSFLAGKEFKIKEKNVLSLNIRALYAGGRRYTAVLLDESNEAGYAVYDTKNAFEARGQAYWRIDLGVSYTINRKNTASVWKIDIQNVTNRLNEFGRFYNFDSRQLEVSTQTGIIPTLSYRFEF